VTDESQLNRLRHDLRTPLTVVIGFAELLASDRELTDDQRRDYASRVLGAGVEMRELIDSDRLDSLQGRG
jgi:signal transduction histidine kinase